MNSWHIISSEYPPDIGGVSDYTHQVAEALAERGDQVHVWCPPTNAARSASRVHIHPELGRFHTRDLRRTSALLDTCPSPRRLLVQWVPHGYGYRSMNIHFCLWLAARAARGDDVHLMVHEPFNELKRGPIRHVAIALVHRLMTIVLMQSAARVWVAIPAWESLLRPYALGRSLRIDWLPIPACLTAPRGPAPRVREKYADAARPLIGHFGSYGDEVSTLLAERLPAIMQSDAWPSLLLIGARGEAFRAALVAQHPAWNTRVHATGYVPPTELTQYLQACDVFLQPYPDGITSRRTSAMACLSQGCPVVTTSGHLTEPFWEASRAVVLAPVSNPHAFTSTALLLLEDSVERSEVARRGQRLYRDRFTVDSVAAALKAA